MYEPLEAEKVPEMIEKLQMRDRSIGLVEFQSEKSLALSQGNYNLTIIKIITYPMLVWPILSYPNLN
jgi:hypothetical protein